MDYRVFTPKTFRMHARSRNLGAFSVLAPLLLLLFLWLWIVAETGSLDLSYGRKPLGDSFVMYLSAARILQSGGNPYDPSQVGAKEVRFRHIPPSTPQEPLWKRLVAEPPLFFWLLNPLTRGAFPIWAAFWALLMYILSGLGFFAILRAFKWRRYLIPIGIFMAMPPTVLGAIYGEPDGLVMAAIGGALYWSRRKPFLAGVLLVFTILKPQIALPAALLIYVFVVHDRAAFTAGVGAAGTALLLLTLVSTGLQPTGYWLQSFSRFSGSMPQQPHLASLIGLYGHWAPADLRWTLEIGAVAFAGLATAYCALPVRGGGRERVYLLASLWTVWFLAAPYAHFYDEILLAVSAVVLLGPDGINVKRPLAVVFLYSAFLSLLVSSWEPIKVNMLSIFVVLMLICVIAAKRNPKYIPASL